jgi:hypothetical protein
MSKGSYEQKQQVDACVYQAACSAPAEGRLDPILPSLVWKLGSNVRAQH